MKIDYTTELTIFFIKKGATSNYDPTGCIEDYIMENHGGKKN
jgi:hypothetical protein